VRGVAAVVSAVFNPFVYATLYLAALALHGVALGPCLLAWGLIVLVPTAVLLWGLRRGTWSDADVTLPRERRVFVPWVTLPAGVAAAVALAAQFEYPLRLSVVGMFLWLAMSALVSLWWKASLHVGGAAGMAVLAWVTFGPGAGLALSGIAVAVAWSRLRLGRHDQAQVAGGCALGILAVALALAAVR
jgi:hypothetical protein